MAFSRYVVVKSAFGLFCPGRHLILISIMNALHLCRPARRFLILAFWLYIYYYHKKRDNNHI